MWYLGDSECPVYQGVLTSGCPVKKVIVSCLSRCPISGCPVKKVIVSCLSRCPISGCPVKKVIVSCLSRCPYFRVSC